jgi:putative cardiolipin synthase
MTLGILPPRSQYSPDPAKSTQAAPEQRRSTGLAKASRCDGITESQRGRVQSASIWCRRAFSTPENEIRALPMIAYDRSTLRESSRDRSRSGPRILRVGFLLLTLLAGSTVDAEQVRILETHAHAAQARVDLVRGAERSIDTAYFIYDDDHAGLAGLYLLREAARRGVTVRLIIDSQWNKVSGAIIAHLVDEGVQVKLYHRFSLFKPFWWTRRMHDKLVIVDAEHLIAGGRNIEDPYFGLDEERNYLDRDIYVRGASAGDSARYFEDLWNSRHVGDPPVARVPDDRREAAAQSVQRGAEYLARSTIVDDSRAGTILSSTTTVPSARFLHDEVARVRKKPGIRKDLLELFADTQETLRIETPYLVVTKGVRRLFRELLDRGVKIRLLTNSLKTTDNVWPQAGYVGRKKKLVRMGIELWEYAGPESLHSKSAVIDGKVVLVGSYNLDPRSERLNTEIAVVVEDRGLAADLEACMQRNLRNSWRIGPDGKPLGQKRRYPGVGLCKRIKVRLIRLILPCVRGQL